MRFSFENGFSRNKKSFASGPGALENRYDKKFAIAKNRRCLNCSKEISDDGSLAYLRGFCTEKCRTAYLDGVSTAPKNKWEEKMA